MVYKLFDQKRAGSVASINEELAQELHKPVIENSREVYAMFKYNIWAADLVEMEWLSSFNGSVKYLLCVIYVFTKYARSKLLKDKKPKIVLHSSWFYWNRKWI